MNVSWQLFFPLFASIGLAIQGCASDRSLMVDLTEPPVAHQAHVSIDQRIEDHIQRWLVRAELVAQENRPLSRAHFEIGPIKIRHEAPNLIHAEFEVDRHSWDEDSLLHIRRTHHSWRMRSDGENVPVLLNAEESSVLPDTGTGTKILCL